MTGRSCKRGDYRSHLRVVKGDDLMKLEGKDRPACGLATIVCLIGGVSLWGVVYLVAWAVSKVWPR